MFVTERERESAYVCISERECVFMCILVRYCERERVCGLSSSVVLYTSFLLLY